VKVWSGAQRACRCLALCLARGWACQMACMPIDARAYASEDEDVGAGMTRLHTDMHAGMRRGHGTLYVMRMRSMQRWTRLGQIRMHIATQTKRKQSMKACKTCMGIHALHARAAVPMSVGRSATRRQDAGKVSAHKCKSARVPEPRIATGWWHRGMSTSRCETADPRHDDDACSSNAPTTLMSPKSARCRSRGHTERRPPQRAA